jgi:dTDP-glucose pyrophosphorylase
MLLNKRHVEKIIMYEDSTILEAINNINSSELKIGLVIDKDKNFTGVINDGDIRRAFLKGFNVNSPIQNILNKKPFFVKSFLDFNNIPEEKLEAFNYVPIIKKKKIQGLYIHNIKPNILKKRNNEHVVIMAGGYGKRLGSLTKDCPKALLKFNNKPLLQHILEHIKKNNFNNIHISVFFLKKIIKKFIYNNNYFSLKIKFLEEKIALGTIGSIRLIKKISRNFIVVNCDVISDINLNQLIKFHKKNKSILTVATKHFRYKNPYGVIVSRNNKFVSFKEKPEIDFLINSGIYVFNKKIISIMNKFDINSIENLIMILKNNKYKVFTYPIVESWHDLGGDKKNLRKFSFKN